MKLSVCIPVYNFDVRQLVLDLKKQIANLPVSAEIILIDDCSDNKIVSTNEEIQNSVNQYIKLNKNLGRSAIRNLFLNYATGDYLLFLDCDGQIIKPDFIAEYLNLINENPQTKVVYGGRVVSSEIPYKEFRLRWKYAKKRENLPVNLRLQNPYLSFQTNNFLIEKNLFKEVQFNPNFSKYGYEDLLFSMELKGKSIEIYHLDNPVLNGDVELNEVYLKKVEDSVENISAMLNNDVAEKLQSIKLVKVYRLLSRSGSSPVFLVLFKLLKNSVKKKLLSGNAPLFMLDFYKIGLLVEGELYK